MDYENYTQSAALALVGRVFESLIEFSDARAVPDGRIPLGTRARVVEVNSSVRGGYDVELEWELAQPNRGRRGQSFRVWFAKDVMSRYMEEVKS